MGGRGPRASGRPVARRLALARLAAERSAAPVPADAAARSAMETRCWPSCAAPTAARCSALSDLCAGLGASARRPAGRTVAAVGGLLRGPGAGLLQADVYAKRVSSRLLAQLRLSIAARPKCPIGWRRTCCSSAPMRARPATPAPRRGWLPCARPTRSMPAQPSTTTRCVWAVSTRPGSRRRASAWPVPRKSGRRWPAANCTG